MIYVILFIMNILCVNSQIDIAKLLRESGYKVDTNARMNFNGKISYNPKQASRAYLGPPPPVDDLSISTTSDVDMPFDSSSTDTDSHSYMSASEVMELNANSPLGGVSNEALKNLIDNCHAADCKKQKSENIICKETLIRLTTEYQNKIHGKDMSSAVRRQFDLIYQYKLALVKKLGLSDTVVPADNGVVDGDIILTEEQAAFMLETVKQDMDVAKYGRRKKRNAMFFGNRNFIQKWDSSKPIQYSFNENLNEKEKQIIREGIRMIEKAGTCLRFVYNQRATGYFLHFVKSHNINACGLTNIGRIANGTQVSLSFTCEDMTGVVAHEVMHGLGVAHMHQRVDRDKNIKIIWTNVDPTHIDKFEYSDPRVYSTYGISYDYESIMHYKSNFAPRVFYKETMIPIRNPMSNTKLLGQRKKLSRSDVELLNKMYCMNNCQDKKVFCGVWANQGMCNSPGRKRFMTSNCKMSCNKCATRG